jgi:hypothetical protein
VKAAAAIRRWVLDTMAGILDSSAAPTWGPWEVAWGPYSLTKIRKKFFCQRTQHTDYGRAIGVDLCQSVSHATGMEAWRHCRKMNRSPRATTPATKGG